ncbi:POT-type proton-dependent oligopeptide transporter [Helicobacter enhydrae]
MFGWEIPTAWFQSVNALFIIIFAPIAGYFWILLAKKNMECGSITKFALGLALAGVSFLIMMLASYVVLGGVEKVSPLWIVTSLLFLTFGELALSPIGLSLMTQIAPRIIRGQVMGLWFVSISLGNVVAGLVGGEVEADKLESLPSVFGQSVVILFTIAVILFLIRKPLNKIAKQRSE